MLKLMARTAKAQKTAKKLKEAQQKTTRHLKEKEARDHLRLKQKVLVENMKAARIARREDYELGPLAPNRHAGEQGEKYGTAAGQLLQYYKLPRNELERAKKRRGENEFRVNDRVVVLRGRERGKIGTVFEVQDETMKILGVNHVEMHVPEWMRKAESSTAPVRSMSAPVPLSDVRLVYPVAGPDGKDREVIVAAMDFRWRQIPGTQEKKRRIPGTQEKDYSVPHKGDLLALDDPSAEENPLITRFTPAPGYKWEKVRYIKGQAVEIVTVKPADEDVDEPYTDSDTLRIQTEKETFLPALTQPPMPPEVIDELRGKYSDYRDRHEPEYIAKKEEIDEGRERLKRSNVLRMMTPHREFSIRSRMAVQAYRKRRAPDVSVLAAIGEHMSRSKSLKLSSPKAVSPEAAP
ncbi:hypothetical protein EJ06DRAFT_69238 [Trichodelitschia bisporula]|uniref:KOW domain-containing protein n=1 Tax=Trichodelitschia bisporula TaxID=703511 RepID=A0A6G1HSU4_9PEZI|nr:hypothetical protein EJ06DRAFT_69238 [Trichodelitschia bisporula]